VAGLVLGLGCLFASFAKEFHQVVLSYGLLLGLGLGITTVSFLPDTSIIYNDLKYFRKQII
jgi:hypothetical protein